MKEKQAVVGRTLTFRAWDKGNDIFRYFNFLETKDVNKFGLGMWEFRYLQQYTGLKDTNGVEIFEGDWLTDNRLTDIVQWCKKCAGWQMAYKYKEEMLCHRCDGNYEIQEILENGLVAGNIYENPNLI